MKFYLTDIIGCEIEIDRDYIYKDKRVTLRGVVDVEAKDTTWEFKCVSSILLEHKLQIIIYAFIKNKDHLYRLLNCKTGEVYTLKYDKAIINQIVDMLLENTMISKNTITDSMFLSMT